MAEATLSMGYSDFRSEIAAYLGYGRTSSNWSVEQIAEIGSYMNSGLRKFYNAYLWKFLNPVETLTTVAGTYLYTAPDYVGGIRGSMTFAPSEGQGRIQVVGEAEIRLLRQGGDISGQPTKVAFRPKSSDGSDGQRYEFLLWPNPSAVYVLTYKPVVLQNALSTSYPYPLGGQQHTETILEMMLAMAEAKGNDQGDGPHALEAQRLLALSIDFDQKLMEPEYYGYNGDRSDDRDMDTVSVNRARTVTVYGVQY